MGEVSASWCSRLTEGACANTDPSVIRQDRAVTPMRASCDATSLNEAGEANSKNTVWDAYLEDAYWTVFFKACG
jgi:hypothetical protein